MRIALVNQPLGVLDLPDPGSSLSIWMYEVARRLGRSHDVVVYSRRGGKQDKVQVYEGVEYRRISGRFDGWAAGKLSAIRGVRAGRPLCGSSLYYLAYAVRVARDLRRWGCDVVHLFNFSQFVPVLRHFCPWARIVLHMQCEWLSQMDAQMIAPRLDKADCIIGCSRYITELIRQRHPQHADHCTTVYNGITLGPPLPAEDHGEGNRRPVRLLYVGRISPEKGLHVLIDAMRIVRQGRIEVRLDLVGPEWVCPPQFLVDLDREGKLADLKPFFRGSYMEQLKQRAGRELEPYVTFLGAIGHSKVMELYRECDVLICASFSEAFGMPLAEAMGCHLPVIATRVGGTPEIVVHGQTGLMVAPNDAAAMAEAIERLCRDESLRRKLGYAGRQRAEELFSWDKIANDVSAIFDNLVGTAKPHGAKGGPATALSASDPA